MSWISAPGKLWPSHAGRPRPPRRTAWWARWPTTLSLDSARTVDVGNLELVGGRAFARSGSVDWLDPVVGARLRYMVVPSQELFLRGDIGGSGVGSEFSWQAVAGYGFDLGGWTASPSQASSAIVRSPSIMPRAKGDAATNST